MANLWDAFKTGAEVIGDATKGIFTGKYNPGQVREGWDWLLGGQDYGGGTSVNFPKIKENRAAQNAAATSYNYNDYKPYQEQRAWIPSLDVNKIYKESQKKAAGEAGGWYQTQLGEFLKNLEYKRGLQKDYYDTSVSELEKGLKDMIEGNVITRGRTQSDTEYNLGRINEEEGARQQMEARSFDATKRGIESSLGESGLSTSGLGRQKLAEAGFKRKMTEEATSRDITEQKQTLNKNLSRTFEDLARSEKLKGEDTELGKRKAKISFDEAMVDLAETEREKRISLEQSRASQQSNLEQAYRINSFMDYYNKLKTAGQRNEFWNQYGGFF